MNYPVAQPPWTGLGKRIESMVRKALFDYAMIADDVEKIGVALSGGKDSLALLFMLKAISGRGFPPFQLHAIHVSGEFSCGAGVNIDYLSGVCKELDIGFTSCESKQKLETLECYSCSRERRSLIFDAAKSVGATTVAFGHHRDDNAQTLLLNLLQKGEFEGNLPKIHMHAYGVTILRPLIYVSEAELTTFAKQSGFLRVMCRCPVGQTSMRKQVDQLLSDLQETFPNARDNIARAGLLYQSGKAGRRKTTDACEW